ncbi:MAG TPA: bile acid:sodium symporter [Methanotrichaceae archaeon]|nr:bile acid:sodium symporter [Methanotrichaceae archaeon]
MATAYRTGLIGLLRNSSVIFAISIALGLALPGPAAMSSGLLTPALILMMTFSMKEIDFKARGSLKEALIGFCLNYLILSGLILVMAYSLDEPLWQGFVVMAAVPPAVAVLPLTRILDGDLHLSLYSEAISYLASIVIMPGVIFLFTSRTGVSFLSTMETALTLILLPLVLSRLVGGLRIDPVIPINLGFFIVTYTVLGMNRDALLAGMGVSTLAVIAFTRTFAIGGAVYAASLAAGMPPEKRISYTLLGSYKNLGLSAAVSLMLFGPAAGMPSAACILAETIFYIFLSMARHRLAGHDPA